MSTTKHPPWNKQQ